MNPKGGLFMVRKASNDGVAWGKQILCKDFYKVSWKFRVRDVKSLQRCVTTVSSSSLPQSAALALMRIVGPKLQAGAELQGKLNCQVVSLHRPLSF